MSVREASISPHEMQMLSRGPGNDRPSSESGPERPGAFGAESGEH
jgi:hypothetical protein